MRVDGDRTAKTALLAMDKLVHAMELMGKGQLTKADISFLQHAFIERPQIFCNDALGRLKDAAKIRLQAEASSQQLPGKFKGISGSRFLNAVLEVYDQGHGEVLEGSVVYHMTLHLVQKLAGVQHPQTSTKLFALARALKHLHKPSYEFSGSTRWHQWAHTNGNLVPLMQLTPQHASDGESPSRAYEANPYNAPDAETLCRAYGAKTYNTFCMESPHLECMK